MSTDSSTPAAVPSASAQWPELDSYERRVLGVLVEKQKTTPDAYPLSLNALVTGCNQKSNRDPMMNVENLEVEATLQALKDKELVIRVQGAGRVERWRHALYEAWQLDKVESAIVAELLLRGAQTEGELRGHVSRMEPVEDLNALRAMLEKLAARRMVVYLTPPGQRGTRLTHGFYPASELDALRHGEPAAQPPAGYSTGAPVAVAKPQQLDELKQALDSARMEIAELHTKLAALEQTVAALRQQLQSLKQSLGA
jgi:uncharacterized protein YceH (UPF0502 family)